MLSLHERHLLHTNFNFLDENLVKIRMSFLKLAYKGYEILLEIHLGDDVDDTFLDDHALRI